MSGSGSPCRYLLSDNDRQTLHYPLHVFLLLDYMEWQKPRRSRVNCGEVKQVNSYLSRCALTTKYMSKGGDCSISLLMYFFIAYCMTFTQHLLSTARVDMLTIHAMAWNYKKNHNTTSGIVCKICEGVFSVNGFNLWLLCSFV